MVQLFQLWWFSGDDDKTSKKHLLAGLNEGRKVCKYVCSYRVLRVDGKGNLTCCVSQHRAKTAAMEFSKHDPLLKSNPQFLLKV